MTLYTTPFCVDIDECFPDDPCTHGDCVNYQGGYICYLCITPSPSVSCCMFYTWLYLINSGDFECACYIDGASGKRWQGDDCNVLPGRSTLRVEESGIIAIVLAIVFALGTVLNTATCPSRGW